MFLSFILFTIDFSLKIKMKVKLKLSQKFLVECMLCYGSNFIILEVLSWQIGILKILWFLIILNNLKKIFL